MRRPLIITILAGLIMGYMYWSAKDGNTPRPARRLTQKPAPKADVAARADVPMEIPEQQFAEPEVVTSPAPNEKKMVLPYKIRDGLMIVQGDVVVGQPAREDLPPEGLVQVRPIQLWPRATIAFHIQPNLSNPERIEEAIALFAPTNIHFVPFSHEEDVLVFELGSEDCLSYVGKMGGKQPVWISPSCSPANIAHEIMHALGFVHEQNRADRDDFLEVHFENIDERYKENFAILPPEFMKVSGLGPFDFQSLMIYPPWMFAKNGQSTMEPKSHDQLLQPGNRLSPSDVERVNRAYSPAVSN